MTRADELRMRFGVVGSDGGAGVVVVRPVGAVFASSAFTALAFSWEVPAQARNVLAQVPEGGVGLRARATGSPAHRAKGLLQD